MRSRYAAFALGRADYLSATWDPETRPAQIRLRPEQQWIGLRIVDTQAGGPADDAGEVEFIARSRTHGRAQKLHERSRFRRENGAWLYVDGFMNP